MIIDAHCHVFPAELLKSARCIEDPSFSELYGDSPADRTSDLEGLLKHMDAGGIDCAVISGFPWQDAGMVRAHNDYLYTCGHKAPDRIIPFAALSPALGPSAIDEAQRCLERGFGGVGEIAFYSEGFGKAQREGLRETMELLGHMRRPLLLHVNEPAGHLYPGKSHFSFQELYRLIGDFPGVDIILAHWGGGFLFYELMPEVRKACRRVYYDTAASPFLYSSAIFRCAAQMIEGQKILLGTDYPLLPIERYIKQMNGSGIDEGLKNAVLGENAARLLHVK